MESKVALEQAKRLADARRYLQAAAVHHVALSVRREREKAVKS